MNYSAFLKSEIKPQITEQNAEKVLLEVVRIGRLKLVKWILKKWPVDNLDDFLIHAAKAGQLSIVKFLHANGADIRAWNNFAVRWAFANGHLPVVEFLHIRGADILSINKCHPKIARYIAAQKWLTTNVHYLKIKAVAIFATNYKIMP